MAIQSNGSVTTDLMTPQQVAAEFTIAVQTLAIWRCTNRQKLPFVKIGNRVRYRRADVEQFVMDRLSGAHAAAFA